jgi:hypothetical protein
MLNCMGYYPSDAARVMVKGERVVVVVVAGVMMMLMMLMLRLRMMMMMMMVMMMLITLACQRQEGGVCVRTSN